MFFGPKFNQCHQRQSLYPKLCLSVYPSDLGGICYFMFSTHHRTLSVKTNAKLCIFCWFFYSDPMLIFSSCFWHQKLFCKVGFLSKRGRPMRMLWWCSFIPKEDKSTGNVLSTKCRICLYTLKRVSVEWYLLWLCLKDEFKREHIQSLIHTYMNSLHSISTTLLYELLSVGMEPLIW